MVRLNSMGEICFYIAEVTGSSPVVATNLVRSSKVEYPAFNRRVRVRFPAGQQREYSSMEEQVVVNHQMNVRIILFPHL
jgi:hypothetical protein